MNVSPEAAAIDRITALLSMPIPDAEMIARVKEVLVKLEIERAAHKGTNVPA